MSVKSKFLQDFSRAILDGTAGLFVGAGTSMAAGYPSWKSLLKEIAEELDMSLDDYDDLAAVAQWAIHEDGVSRTRVSQAILDQIGPDKPIPEALNVIARLPLSEIWTTNYDRLIERSLATAGRPYDLKASQPQLTLKSPNAGCVKLYKMHGTIDDTSNLVIATDDYELYKNTRHAFLNLFQAHLMSKTFLFLGVSLTDPNLKHILSSIRRFFPLNPPRHYLVTKTPARDEFDSDDAFHARLTRHKLWAKDLKRYGFVVVEVKAYAEIDEMLVELERSIAKQRVWVAGSWFEDDVSPNSVRVREIAEQIGLALAHQGFTLVSGSGLVVGPASIRGFLNGLQADGAWDLERRFIVRPFPQPSPGKIPDRTQWGLLREEMARLAGTVVLIGGMKRLHTGAIELGLGVKDEAERVGARGGAVIPIGSTGGVAELLLREMESGASGVISKSRPLNRAEIEKLKDPGSAPSDIAKAVCDIIKRVLEL